MGETNSKEINTVCNFGKIELTTTHMCDRFIIILFLNNTIKKLCRVSDFFPHLIDVNRRNERLFVQHIMRNAALQLANSIEKQPLVAATTPTTTRKLHVHESQSLPHSKHLVRFN